MQKRALSYNHGFTIVELLVVVVVLSILATLIVISYDGISQRAIAISLQSDLESAAAILEMDKNRSNDKSYPATKEDANGGNGLSYSGDNILTYSYNESNDSYCLEAENNGAIYHTSSNNTVPAEGACPAGSFVMALGGSSYDSARSVKQTSDGGYIFVGQTQSYGAGSNDVLIAKYDSSGNISWNKTWGGSDNDFAYDVIQTSGGEYVITGGTTSNSGGMATNAFIIKLDSSGDYLWDKVWGSAMSENASRAIIQSNDGGYVIASSVMGDPGSEGAAIAKFDSNGSFVWSRAWDGLSLENSNDVIQDSNGDYVFVGGTWSNDGGSHEDLLIIKTNSTGSIIWAKTWGSNTSDEQAYSVAQASDGGYVVTGYITTDGDRDMYIAKGDSDGNLVWSRAWGGSGYDQGNSIVVTNDGYVVAGETRSFGAGGSDAAVVKFDLDGNLIWSRTWGGGGYDYMYNLHLTDDGGFITAGTVVGYGAGGNEAYISKYLSNGTISGCSSPMCQSPSVTIDNPSSITTVPSGSNSSISLSVSANTGTVTSPSAASTVIVAAE